MSLPPVVLHGPSFSPADPPVSPEAIAAAVNASLGNAADTTTVAGLSTTVATTAATAAATSAGLAATNSVVSAVQQDTLSLHATDAAATAAITTLQSGSISQLNQTTALATAAATTRTDVSALQASNATLVASNASLSNAVTILQNTVAALQGLATVPNAPTALSTGTITSSTIVFNWVAAVGGSAATGYILQRSPTGINTWTTSDTIGSTAVTVTTTPPGAVGTLYDWRVAGTNGSGTGPASFPLVTVGTLAAVPTAPTGLSGSVFGSTIIFTWNAGAGGTAATGYILQRSPTGANTFTTANTIATTAVTVTTTPPGVPGTGYDWRVLGTNGSGSGPPSNQVTLGIPATVPTQPTGLVASGLSATQVTFTWVAGAGGTPATGYTLLRSPAGAGTYTPAATTTAPTVTTTVTPPGAQATAYDWHVFGSNAVGPGPVSAPPVTAGTSAVVVGTRIAANIPFSSTSVWNIGIGSAATWGTSGNPDVVLLRTATMTFASAAFSLPIYFGGPSDPLVTVSCAGGGQDGDWPFSVSMHVPIGATPATGSDHHMILFDSTQPNMAVSIWGATLTNGVNVTGGITSGLGAKLDLTLNGISRSAGDYLGTDDYLGGMITSYDLAQGAITHAVRISIDVGSTKPANMVDGSTTGVPWPNYFEDFFGPEVYTGGTNGILAGSTFGIPASVNLATLGLTAGGLILATALQKYGAIWRDSGGGSHTFNFYTTPPNTTHPLITQMNSDGAKIMAVMNIMRNQSSDNGVTNVNGGGTYPTPLPGIVGVTDPSPAWTSIPSATRIIMNDGGVVTNVGGVVMLNGAPMGFSDDVILIRKSDTGAIYQESNDPSLSGLPGGVGWYFWDAVTTPSSTWTFAPGGDPLQGVTGGTSPPRQQMLTYLQSISGVKTLFGQTSFPDEREFNADTAGLGISPAVMFNDPWIVQFAGSAAFDPSFMAAALAHAAAGGIVGMSMLLPNPVDLGPSTSGPAVNATQILTPGSALNTALNGMLNQAAGLLQQFKDAGRAVLTRYMFELDHGGFWWGVSVDANGVNRGGNFTNAQQTLLFQYITNYFRVTKGLDNLLITFAVNGGPGTYQYPGDNYVDIIGIDSYTDNLAGVYGPWFNTLRAQAPSKLFALTEFGSGDPNAPDTLYDTNRIRIDIQSSLPRTCYVNFWSGWQPVLYQNAVGAMNNAFWIHKGQVVLPT